MTHRSSQLRVASRYLFAEEGDTPPKIPWDRLLSDPARRKLLQAFTQRGMPFFDLYYEIYAFFHGLPAPPEGFVEKFRAVSRLVYQLLTTEDGKNKFMDASTELRPLLNRVDQGADDPMLGQRIALLYGGLLSVVSSERDVYLRGRPIDVHKWQFFRLMTAREEKFERLKRDDPAMYDNIQQGRKMLQKLDRTIEDTIVENGMMPEQAKLLDQLVMIGTDPKTGDRYVFPPDGNVLTVDEYMTERKRYLRSQRKLERVFPEDLDDMRKITDEEIASFADGPVTYYAITDDKAKQNAVTRVYPVQNVGGELAVVSGRFKGFYVNDLINSSGRMIEGVAFDYDPKLGRPVQMEMRNPDGTLNVRVSREPYVTLTPDGKLYLKLPSNHAYTAQRNAVAELSKLVPSIVYVDGSRKSAYTFDPKDFAALRGALGGLTLSTSAMEFIRTYFTQLARHELATNASNLQHYSMAKIGGFKPGRELFTKQKQALAWAESRGMSGVIALDTGVGKTSFAIAAMQKMRRDGFLDNPENGNGRFLYVCPTALKGNLPKEIYAFIEDAPELIDRVDILSFAEFSNAQKKDPQFAKNYVAIFFDEAQALKNPTSAVARAALSLNHPRKIPLTASPMERSPMEVFVLVAVANNIDLNTPEGRSMMRAFRKRFCEEVGGRIIGMKSDPITARDLRVWVKRNLFFADKRDVEEIALPQLRKNTVALSMEPAVEAKYREITDGIQKVMTGLVAKYRDRVTKGIDPAVESARMKLKKQFQELTDLALMPDLIVPGARNPKLEQSVRVIDERVGSGGRTLLFTDSPKMAAHTVQTLSNRLPGKLHAVGFSDRIEIWQDGRMVTKYDKKPYRAPDGSKYKPSDWKVFVLKYVVQANPEVVSLTLTSTYAVGQNLQQFSTVVHLDRDTWNSETMKQRTARAWRTGQKNSVEEITLDAVYSDVRSKMDATLDEIRGAMQQLEGELFDRVVIESQTEALGKEFFDMKRIDASFYELNRRMMEMQLSPYLARIGEES